jgi:CRAL/TRIO domain
VAAVAKAQAGGSWNNAAVLSAAPHSASISKYLTPSNMLTTTSSQGDLVYCVRAGKINDVELMNAVSIDALTDFFVYAKEVNSLVSMQRSLESDRLVCVITANDLSGINLIGGSADFRKALSASSKEAADLYPATNGPSLILNLPALLSALVKLFTPLFPEAVRQRIKFENGPLKKLSSLEQVASSKADNSPERAAFLKDLDTIVYSS